MPRACSPAASRSRRPSRLGQKLVEFLGAGGSYGSATYVGRGQIVTETAARILTTVVRRWDPLAQTFTLPERRTIGGLELWFTTKGGSASGRSCRSAKRRSACPTTTVLTEGRLLASDIKTDGNRAGSPSTRWRSRPTASTPSWCSPTMPTTPCRWRNSASTTRAPVGSAQPYQIGVLLSSSTASPGHPPDAGPDVSAAGLPLRRQSKTVSWASTR